MIQSLIHSIQVQNGWPNWPKVTSRRVIIQGNTTAQIATPKMGIVTGLKTWLEATNLPQAEFTLNANGTIYTYNRQTMIVNIFPSVVSPSVSMLNTDAVAFKAACEITQTAVGLNHYSSVYIIDLQP